jgi:hypothetical protein
MHCPSMFLMSYRSPRASNLKSAQDHPNDHLGIRAHTGDLADEVALERKRERHAIADGRAYRDRVAVALEDEFAFGAA